MNQLLCSGTSVWANVEEAIGGGQTKKIFLLKYLLHINKSRETLLAEADQRQSFNG